MKSRVKFFTVGLCLLMAILWLVSCSEKRERKGKVIVTESKFFIRKDGDFNWTIDATGKIRNTGQVDLKNVVVTAYCRSCGEVLTSGTWYISDVPKTSGQEDTIQSLPVGAEKTFSFKEVAFYFNQAMSPPETLPEKLEVVVESFETAK